MRFQEKEAELARNGKAFLGSSQDGKPTSSPTWIIRAALLVRVSEQDFAESSQRLAASVPIAERLEFVDAARCMCQPAPPAPSLVAAAGAATDATPHPSLACPAAAMDPLRALGDLLQQNAQRFATNLRQAGDRAAEALARAALPQQQPAVATLLAVGSQC